MIRSATTPIITTLIVGALLSWPGSGEAASRTFTFPPRDGVSVELVIVPGSGGVRYGNYHFQNANPYDVEVRWDVLYTRADGSTQQKRNKGPFRVKAYGHARTGWSGDGDIFDSERDVPVSVRLERFEVIRPGAKVPDPGAPAFPTIVPTDARGSTTAKKEAAPAADPWGQVDDVLQVISKRPPSGSAATASAGSTATPSRPAARARPSGTAVDNLLEDLARPSPAAQRRGAAAEEARRSAERAKLVAEIAARVWAVSDAGARAEADRVVAQAESAARGTVAAIRERQRGALEAERQRAHQARRTRRQARFDAEEAGIAERQRAARARAKEAERAEEKATEERKEARRRRAKRAREAKQHARERALARRERHRIARRTKKSIDWLFKRATGGKVDAAAGVRGGTQARSPDGARPPRGLDWLLHRGANKPFPEEGASTSRAHKPFPEERASTSRAHKPFPEEGGTTARTRQRGARSADVGNSPSVGPKRGRGTKGGGRRSRATGLEAQIEGAKRAEQRARRARERELARQQQQARLQAEAAERERQRQAEIHRQEEARRAEVRARAEEQRRIQDQYRQEMERRRREIEEQARVRREQRRRCQEINRGRKWSDRIPCW